ncbi:hypothetical protein [Actinoplanes sp. NPDC051494]|uniref:hypothetical protein n=1 Tax=Actinoplanes sp. NPDC051494 TaxID=3363907 RepID=UPI0037B1E4ED
MTALVAWLREQLEIDVQAADTVDLLDLELPEPPPAVPGMVFMSPEEYVSLTGVLSGDRIRANAAALLRIVDRHAECGSGAGYCRGPLEDGALGCPDLLDVAAMFTGRPGFRW